MDNKKIHYAISDKNAGPTLCSRFVDNSKTTRVTGCVTCETCKKLIVSNNYSVSQFVGK